MQSTDSAEPGAPKDFGEPGSVSGTADRGLDITTGATGREARRLRLQVEHWLQRVGAPPALVDDLGLAVYEALANAVEHAYRPEQPGTVQLSARTRHDQVVIRVSDDGCWRTPGETGNRGRGLALIRELVDTQVEHGPSGTDVWLHVPLTGRDSN